MARLTARDREMDRERARERAREKRREGGMDKKKRWVFTFFPDVCLVFLPSYLYLCTTFSLFLNNRIMFYPS